MQRWRRLLDWLLLGLGVSLVLVGLVLFVAFNWSALPPMVKMGLVAALIAGAASTALAFRALVAARATRADLRRGDASVLNPMLDELHEPFVDVARAA